MRLLVVCIFHLISTTVFTQPVLVWQHCNGGTEMDEGSVIISTLDNGYVVAGVTDSNDGDILFNHGGDDVLIIKFDSTNNITWKKTYGGSLDEAPFSIIETSDNGFVFVGYTGSSDGDVSFNHGEEDIWLVKLDSIGNLIWEESYGGTDIETGFSIISNTNDNFIILGSTLSIDGDVTFNHGLDDFWLIEIDQFGSLISQKCFGGSDSDWGHQVRQTQDGGYILSGFTLSSDGQITFNHGEEDIWIVKLDSIGTVEWERSYGGSESEITNNILEIQNGNFVFAATTSSSDGDVQNIISGPDFWTVQIDGAGNLINQNCFGGTNMDYAWGLIQTFDSGYAIIGSSLSNDVDVSDNNGYVDSWVLKTDINFLKQWSLCFGGSDEEVGYSLAQLRNDDLVVTGFTYSNDSDVVGNHGNNYQDIWTYRLTGDIAAIHQLGRLAIGVYPNPSVSHLNLQGNIYDILNDPFKVYNQFGQTVIEGRVSNQIDINKLTQGKYTLCIFTRRGCYMEEFIKE